MKIENNVIYFGNVDLVDQEIMDNYFNNDSNFSKLLKTEEYELKNDKKLNFLTVYFIVNYLKSNNIDFGDLYFEYGKPLVRIQNHYFSIAHKNKYCVFIASDEQIGIDIEEIISGKYRYITAKYFPNFIDKTDSENFFKYWTKTEALIKCENIPFEIAAKKINNTNNVEVDVIDNLYFFYNVKYYDMRLSVCKKNTENINYSKYELKSIDFIN